MSLPLNIARRRGGGSLTHAQIAELTFDAAQGNAHSAQQALVKTGGIETMVFIRGQRRQILRRARFSPDQCDPDR